MGFFWHKETGEGFAESNPYERIAKRRLSTVFPKAVENLWKRWKTSEEFSTEDRQNQGFQVFHRVVSTACAGCGKRLLAPSFWGFFWGERLGFWGFWGFSRSLRRKKSAPSLLGKAEKGSCPQFVPREKPGSSQFVYTVKALRRKGWRGFSTASTAPTTTTKFIGSTNYLRK